jgi:hypothetical protein
MDVAVDQKRGKGRLRSIAHASLLGDGLLERARATTLGLLGAAGAVGLAMIALAFNQGWPLVAGGPVPPLPPREQGVAEARVVAAPAPDRQTGAGAAARSRAASANTDGAAETPTPEDGSVRAPSSELVVVRATPVEQQDDAPPGGAHTSPPPAKPKATPAPQTEAKTTEQAPASPPVQAPPPAPEPTSPPATVSEAPESSVPPWSKGKGHAYGRSGWEDDGWEGDD